MILDFLNLNKVKDWQFDLKGRHIDDGKILQFRGMLIGYCSYTSLGQDEFYKVNWYLYETESGKYIVIYDLIKTRSAKTGDDYEERNYEQFIDDDQLINALHERFNKEFGKSILSHNPLLYEKLKTMEMQEVKGKDRLEAEKKEREYYRNKTIRID